MFCHHCVDTSTGGLLVSNGISVSVYLLDIFIVEIYSFYLNNVIFIKKIRFYSLRHWWPYQICCHLVSTLVCSQTLNVYRNWWWLLQKRAVCTKFDIYVFIAPVVISIKLLQESASFFSNGRGACRGEGYLRQNWVQWRNWSLKINPHSYIPSANYINPDTFFVFEIWKLYPFMCYSVLYYKGPSWSWSNLVGLTNTYYICNQCLSPLTL